MARKRPSSSERDAARTNPFALRQAMRERMRAARKKGAIAFLDIGSSKTACLLGRIETRDTGEPALKILGAGLHRARGVRLGAVVDMGEAERSIRAAVNQAERDTGERAFHAIVNITGAHPRSHALGSEVALSSPRVGDKDMGKALQSCRLPPEGDDRALLHAIAVNWSVDGENGVRDPRGFSGRRLAVDLHLLTIAEAAARNLAHCLAKADLELSGLIATPFASGLACLSEEERVDGAACIDIGGGVASVSMFLKGVMVFADLVRLGGDQITLDVMRRFGLSSSEAERLKTLEGSAATLASAAAETVALPSDHAGRRDGGRVTRADLTAAIRPRVDEIMELARDRLAQAGFFYLPTPRVVLTGGGALLDGVLEPAQAVFGPHARVGRPERPPGLPVSHAGPPFSALAGVCQYALAPQEQFWERGDGGARPAKGAISGLFQWLRETW